MTSYHVTVITEQPNQTSSKFSVSCSCGWKSAEQPTRQQAVFASRTHRVNAAVQVM